jgi:hypothetical protein
MGFTVGARNRHPWGTHNRLVQLPGFFVELLTLAEPEKLGTDGFSELFGRFNQRFLVRHEGLSVALLESHDAHDDARAFHAAGIGASEALRFERDGKRPDGRSVRVAFSLAFAHDPLASEIGFAVCQQHYPENFWNPDFQAHANGVVAIGGIVLVAENPTDHHIFLTAWSGERELQSTSSGITVATPRGEIQIMEPSAYRGHFGIDPPSVVAGARLAALRFVTRNEALAEETLDRAGIAHSKTRGRLVVGPEMALGAGIVFESAA